MTTATTEITTATLTGETTLAGIDHAPADAMYPKWYGVNYNAAHTVKDIAAIIRTTLRTFIKNGNLGPVTNVTVRKDGHNAIRVNLTVPKVKVDADTPGAVECIDRWNDTVWAVIDGNYATPGAADRIEPAAREALKRVENFIATFNHNGSNVQIDYFDVKFYTTVNLVKEGDKVWH